jgi:hypothetical protein
MTTLADSFIGNESRYAFEAANGATPQVDAVRWPAEWTERVVQAIQALADLSTNWDSYGSNAVDRRSIEYAVRRIRQISTKTTAEPRVACTATGFVTLTWEWNRDLQCLEIEFLIDGRIRFGYFDDQRDFAIENIVPLVGDFLSYISLIPEATASA